MTNRLIQGSCIEKLKEIPDSNVNLTVTSPPYDNIRSYKNISWNQNLWENCIKELFRVTIDSGVVVWVVNDQTKNGSESGTSFKQALYFIKCGFRLHDTMIFAKNNPLPLKHKRYTQSFEYMFVFCKGKIKTFNPIKIKCKYAGAKGFGNRTIYEKLNGVDKLIVKKSNENIQETKIKDNIWYYTVGSLLKNPTKHPAVFPYQLAYDHIFSWSNKGDTVLDPFMGSGTTGIACKYLKRNFIGIELSQEYFKKAEHQIKIPIERSLWD